VKAKHIVSYRRIFVQINNAFRVDCSGFVKMQSIVIVRDAILVILQF